MSHKLFQPSAIPNTIQNPLRSTPAVALTLLAAALLYCSISPALASSEARAWRISTNHSPSHGAVHVEHDGALWELPLLDTRVDAEITGFVADVEVRQVFSNPFNHPIEALYLFPLPDNAAVNDMTMQVGERRIVGEIHKREDARRIYQRAKNAGKTAALLDQERPNMFTQHVANILPGEQIDITIHFVQTLTYLDEGYEWVFPMVVGPRYIPAEGAGSYRQQDDARRLDAPYASSPTGNRISLQVSLDAGVPIQGLRSPSHKLLVQHEDEAHASLSIDWRDQIPNKDFVLRYDVAGEAPDAALITHRSGLGGYFLLMLQPQAPKFLTDSGVTPKEMVFVVDTSCSMSGFPIDKAKDAMRLAIAEMNPQDRFTVLDFNDSVSGLSPLPLPNTAYNRAMGTRFVNKFRGSGGTQMLKGIKAALDLPSEEDMLRTVLFMTDGYIGNEDAILSAIGERLGRSRLFSLGVGSSVNRFLLDRMAKMGRGQVQYLRPDEDATGAVEAFYERIRNPVLTDIEIQWHGVEVEQVMPDPVPDLFAGQPVILVGRYDKPGRGSVTIRGRVRGEMVEQTIDVVLPRQQDENSALASVWARKVIDDLESRQHGRPSKALQGEITDLALEYGLLSKYTSFVAVEETRRAERYGPSRIVRVPLENPEFVDLSATIGSTQSAATAAYSSRQMHQQTPLPREGGNYKVRSPGPGTAAPVTESDPAHEWSAPLADAEVEWLDGNISDLAAAESLEPNLALVQAMTEESWPGLSQRQVLRQLQQGLAAVQARWSLDARSYPNAGKWRLRLHVDANGTVTRIEVQGDSLRHGALRGLLRSLEGTLQLPAARSGLAVELNVVISFSPGG